MSSLTSPSLPKAREANDAKMEGMKRKTSRRTACCKLKRNSRGSSLLLARAVSMMKIIRDPKGIALMSWFRDVRLTKKGIKSGTKSTRGRPNWSASVSGKRYARQARRRVATPRSSFSSKSSMLTAAMTSASSARLLRAASASLRARSCSSSWSLRCSALAAAAAASSDLEKVSPARSSKYITAESGFLPTASNKLFNPSSVMSNSNSSFNLRFNVAAPIAADPLRSLLAVERRRSATAAVSSSSASARSFAASSSNLAASAAARASNKVSSADAAALLTIIVAARADLLAVPPL
mmetsp:Transcript_4450/g.10811  ORF Transcript_4450/g.10811 Transcript_4450/m.10811 type:complete len:295 (+) Transcript_4450:197-1081(+)